MQIGTQEIISKKQRERLSKPNIAFMPSVRLSGTATSTPAHLFAIFLTLLWGRGYWNSFLNKTEKKTYYLSVSLNVKSKKRYFNIKKN